MATESKLVWNEIAADTLSGEVQTAYADYKRAYIIMKGARIHFEAELNNYARSQGVIDDEQELAVAYNFGKLSVAVAPKRERKASRKAIGLSEIGQ